MVEIKGWEDMRTMSARVLEERTGEGLETWNGRVAATGITDEPALRAWLEREGVTGYAQQLLVHERFGYPEFLLTPPDELIDAQYADRPRLGPILDGILALLPGLGDVTVQARKTFVSVVGPRRTFALVKAATRSRVDLGLRLDGAEPSGRLLPAKSLGNDAIALRIPLTSVDEIDDEVVDWLQRAYDANL